jgi:hypothetical protein
MDPTKAPQPQRSGAFFLPARDLPSPRGMTAGRIDLGGGACLLLTDCRSFRTRPDAPRPGAFGEAHWRWSDEQVDGGGVTLLARATTLDEAAIRSISFQPATAWSRRRRLRTRA